MDLLSTWLASWSLALQQYPLAHGAIRAIAIYGVLCCAVMLAERHAASDLSRYRRRGFLNDVLYTIFYRGGLYGTLVLAACTAALEPRLAFLRLEVLAGLPWPVGLALFWIGSDFALYWLHRLQHSNRFLWALHSVHHSQQELNLLTAYRRHPVETLIGNVLVLYVLFQLVLGLPARGWMPLAAVISALIVLQHAQLDWGFGPLHRIVVSPRFHAFHHSVDPAHANANFGMVLSIWDYLFGTAVPEQARPTRFGVDGIDFHESLVGQLLVPFKLMWRWRRAAPDSAGATEPVASASGSGADA